ncbi:MAG: hypothetical protein NC453_20190 [Muribaculum sp.]|nr:hypothetical protein [Muribaculum sp.]
MNQQEFIEAVKSLGTVTSSTGKEYDILSVSEFEIIGVRPNTFHRFTIKTERLYRAYISVANDEIPLTTTALKRFVPGVQSPSVAILRAMLY